MRKGCVLALILAFGLGGCAGLRQFPEVTQDHDATLRELDLDYAKTIDLIYGKDDIPKAVVDGTQARQLRNRMMERRMAVIDVYFKDFQAGLVKETVRADFLIALVGVGVGGAGALVSETASQILSAVSGGLAGGQAAYSKAVLYDKAMSALIAQMQASRKVIAGRIFQRWALDIDKYPMWMARTDLEAYYFAGSLPGAIIATAADAKVKEDEADRILLRPITLESVSPEMFAAREGLEASIDALAGDKAKDLVAKVGTEFTEVKPFIDAQYPAAVRAGDTDGKLAKVLLKRLSSSTVRSAADADKWRSLLTAP